MDTARRRIGAPHRGKFAADLLKAVVFLVIGAVASTLWNRSHLELPRPNLQAEQAAHIRYQGPISHHPDESRRSDLVIVKGRLHVGGGDVPALAFATTPTRGIEATTAPRPSDLASQSTGRQDDAWSEGKVGSASSERASVFRGGASLLGQAGEDVRAQVEKDAAVDGGGVRVRSRAGGDRDDGDEADDINAGDYVVEERREGEGADVDKLDDSLVDEADGILQFMDTLTLPSDTLLRSAGSHGDNVVRAQDANVSSALRGKFRDSDDRVVVEGSVASGLREQEGQELLSFARNESRTQETSRSSSESRNGSISTTQVRGGKTDETSGTGISQGAGMAATLPPLATLPIKNVTTSGQGQKKEAPDGQPVVLGLSSTAGTNETGIASDLKPASPDTLGAQSSLQQAVVVNPSLPVTVASVGLSSGVDRTGSGSGGSGLHPIVSSPTRSPSAALQSLEMLLIGRAGAVTSGSKGLAPFPNVTTEGAMQGGLLGEGDRGPEGDDGNGGGEGEASLEGADDEGADTEGGEGGEGEEGEEGEGVAKEGAPKDAGAPFVGRAHTGLHWTQDVIRSKANKAADNLLSMYKKLKGHGKGEPKPGNTERRGVSQDLAALNKFTDQFVMTKQEYKSGAQVKVPKYIPAGLVRVDRRRGRHRPRPKPPPGQVSIKFRPIGKLDAQMHRFLPATDTMLDDGTKYRSCAVVGNGGGLLLKPYGEEINRHDAIFRFNGGPVEGFEEHVGNRTTYRLTNSEHFGFRTSAEEILLQHVTMEETLQAFHLYCRALELLGDTAHMNEYRGAMLLIDPHLQLFALREMNGGAPSNGFYGALVAGHLCATVTFYGFQKDWSSTQVHYHYYDDIEPNASQKSRDKLEAARFMEFVKETNERAQERNLGVVFQFA